MPTLHKSRKAMIRSEEPITECGLTFYHITMQDYEEYLDAVPSLILRQSTLPVKFAIMDFTKALFAMEMEAIETTGQAIGIFERLLRILYLSLRIGYDPTEAIKNVSISIDEKGEKKLDHILVTQDEKSVKITPTDFSQKIRPLIAEINGLELPKESENADIIKAEEEYNEYLAARRSSLNINTEDLIASVAAQYRTTPKEIYKWSVRSFTSIEKAIERDKSYMLYSAAELGGMVSFKNGNPYPSWKYDSKNDSHGTLSLSELQNKTKGVEEKT